jgi:DNA-binding NarL/FixJ family response regulator
VKALVAATAKTHVSRAMGKLDARDRAQDVVMAPNRSRSARPERD